MRKILFSLIVLLSSCNNQSLSEHQFISYKTYLYYKYGNPNKEYNIQYTRQKISNSESIWFTENIRDSTYIFNEGKINKIYFNLVDTVEYEYLKNKGVNDGKVIEINQNKSHLELKEDDSAISFKEITYSRPKILEDNYYPQDTIKELEYLNSRIYSVDGKQFKIYCFAYMEFCEECVYQTIYFSKEFGLLANYSIDYGHLSLIDSIDNREKLALINQLKIKLEQDTLFFPYPNSIRK